jgi:UDP-glucose 4-epimerase
MNKGSKNKILVTGSAGFMGSHLVDYLIEHGHKVAGLDNLSGGNMRNVGQVARKTFFKIDLRNKGQTADFIKKYQPQVIFHLAASAHEGLSQFTPIHHLENNLGAYINLLVPAINHGLARMVVFSSMAVYGAQKPPFSEELKRNPEDIYGVAKVAMEETTEILSKVHKFEYVILRPHNVYGPRQNLSDPYRNVIAIFINSLLRNKPFYIYGDGNQKRAFSYIDDITSPIARTGFEKGLNGQIINIGPSRKYTINYLAQLVLASFKSKLKPIYLPPRPQEVKNAYSTSQKAEKLLGFRERIGLEQGVSLMVKWAKSLGPQKVKYFKSLEIESINTPLTWKRKLI